MRIEQAIPDERLETRHKGPCMLSTPHQENPTIFIPEKLFPFFNMLTETNEKKSAALCPSIESIEHLFPQGLIQILIKSF